MDPKPDPAVPAFAHDRRYGFEFAGRRDLPEPTPTTRPSCATVT